MVLDRTLFESQIKTWADRDLLQRVAMDLYDMKAHCHDCMNETAALKEEIEGKEGVNAQIVGLVDTAKDNRTMIKWIWGSVAFVGVSLFGWMVKAIGWG